MVTHPSEVTVVYPLPADETTYLANSHQTERFDFQCDVAWETYRRHVLRPFNELAAEIEPMGVKIVREATLSDLGHACRPETKVVSLLAHWSDAKVEFSDGLRTIDEIVGVVPIDYRGIVDLCVCHPEDLTLRLKTERAVMVRWINRRTNPHIWFRFYRVLFNILHESPTTFFEAIEKASLALLERK